MHVCLAGMMYGYQEFKVSDHPWLKKLLRKPTISSSLMIILLIIECTLDFSIWNISERVGMDIEA